jgi:uncharacterized membrane protein
MVSLVAAFGLVNILLASFGQNDLAVYLVVNGILYLVVALFYVNLNPKAQTAMNRLSAAIFVGFLFILTLKMVEILA